jgi:hypothetical protein
LAPKGGAFGLEVDEGYTLTPALAGECLRALALSLDRRERG